jgi:TolB-like protein
MFLLSGVLFSLDVIGPFRLCAPDGRSIAIASKKGRALLALLVMAGGGERTRSWLQSMLWGSRAMDQAQASLRNELSALRPLLNSGEKPLLSSDKNTVWIDLSMISVDARNVDGTGHKGVFLEGIDIAGEEEFEEWLREERAQCAARAEQHAAAARTPQPPAEQLLPLADFTARPALAILPFANQTGDASLDFLAEGLSEDLIDSLYRLRWLPIIARGSSFTLRDPDQDPKIAGQILGARYVLEGRLRRSGTQHMLTTALVNSETGQLLWSRKFEVADGDGPTLFEDMIAGLAATLGTRIDQEEQSRALQKPQSDLNVRDLIWRGRWHLNRMTKKDAVRADACFAEALTREPTSPEAIIQTVWARVWALWAVRGSEEDIRALRHMAQKAIIADCDDARGHMLAGIAEIWLHQPLRAEALLHRSIELNPSLAMAHAQLGASLRVRDENIEAVRAFRTAMRLSPNDHDMFFMAAELAASLLMLGDYEGALHHAENAIGRRRGYWFAHVLKVNALYRLHRLEEAKLAYAELLTIKANFRPDFIRWSPFTDPKNVAFLEEGLNQAAL